MFKGLPKSKVDLGQKWPKSTIRPRRWTWARNEGRTGPEVVQVAIKIRVPSKVIGPAARGSRAGSTDTRAREHGRALPQTGRSNPSAARNAADARRDTPATRVGRPPAKGEYGSEPCCCSFKIGRQPTA